MIAESTATVSAASPDVSVSGAIDDELYMALRAAGASAEDARCCIESAPSTATLDVT